MDTARGEIDPSKIEPERVERAYTGGAFGGDSLFHPQDMASDAPTAVDPPIENYPSYSYQLPATKRQVERLYDVLKTVRET